jgi:hypothetical protein
MTNLAASAQHSHVRAEMETRLLALLRDQHVRAQPVLALGNVGALWSRRYFLTHHLGGG